MTMFERHMPAVVEDRLASLKARIDKAREDKARAEATIEQLDAQRQQILAELEQLGVTEAELPGEIDRLQREIEEQLAAAEALLAGTGGQSHANIADTPSA